MLTIGTAASTVVARRVCTRTSCFLLCLPPLLYAVFRAICFPTSLRRPSQSKRNGEHMFYLSFRCSCFVISPQYIAVNCWSSRSRRFLLRYVVHYKPCFSLKYDASLSTFHRLKNPSRAPMISTNTRDWAWVAAHRVFSVLPCSRQHLEELFG